MQSWTLPTTATCNLFSYTVVGGGGGGGNVFAGSGASLSGSFIATLGSSVTVAVGGGGEYGHANAVRRGGWGFGSGGSTSVANPSTKSYGPLGAGGGGSALSVAGTLVVVAGGGGGTRWRASSAGALSSPALQQSLTDNLPHGGTVFSGDYANGEDGCTEWHWYYSPSVAVTTPDYYGHKIYGGHGAVGGTGGDRADGGHLHRHRRVAVQLQLQRPRPQGH
ncbi:MAG: hypothetical protein ACK5MP_02125 [Nostocoides sp.]